MLSSLPGLTADHAASPSMRQDGRLDQNILTGHVCFYGGDIRSYELEWFERQVHAMAGLPASDEDDDRVVGVFFISVEEYKDEAVQWLVRDGSVHEVLADPRHMFLDL